MIKVVGLVIGTALAGSALGVEEVKRAAPPEVMSAASLMQVAGGLLLVVGLIFLISWLLRRVNGINAGHGGKMKVLAGIALGPRDRLVLVQVGDKQILLGASPGRINCLHVFDDPVIEPGEPATGEFARKLQEMVHRGNLS
ncbi:flagellar biosynthetic protein FliO [Aestuariirhabdus litorea]|uniref:Flagellar protein n=1 Tax=Aestuariirhabdus litorea TaxID=2528527 RepID=A0A3P3VRQ8_9GAMM|nr:flagellar biosynthetic protein FliO [Aestuariirhabdus litorea]RRJ84987.1 flagellar biosynthetic protein FliO [Aestuariirhabdus litorea]RWW98699.1 flagellar biosynthetic protein FliO [Endozoicomonadaceae bacterium GTF-13]